MIFILRILGKILGNALPRQGLKRKPTLQKEDKIYLNDVQKDGELCQPIVLDFE